MGDRSEDDTPSHGKAESSSSITKPRPTRTGTLGTASGHSSSSVSSLSHTRSSSSSSSSAHGLSLAPPLADSSATLTPDVSALPQSQSSLSTTKLTVIVVPTVVGTVVIALLFALLVRRCRRRRHAVDNEMRNAPRNIGDLPPPMRPPMAALPPSELILQNDFASYAKRRHDSYSYSNSDHSFHFPRPAASYQSHDGSEYLRSPLTAGSHSSSPLMADHPTTPDHHRVAAWRPERLPESSVRSADSMSSHSRANSLAERRSQRINRALKDAEPPVPDDIHGLAI